MTQEWAIVPLTGIEKSWPARVLLVRAVPPMKAARLA